MAQNDKERLFEAVEFNDAPELRKLLQYSKADVNAINEEGWSLLHKVAQLGHFDCMKVLLEYPNIKVNIKGPGRMTPLFCAIENGHVGCITALLAHKNINVNSLTVEMIAPLHFAVLNGNIVAVRLLLAHKNIHVTMMDKNGKTALDLAQETKHTNKDDIIKLLQNYDERLSSVPQLLNAQLTQAAPQSSSPVFPLSHLEPPQETRTASSTFTETSPYNLYNSTRVGSNLISPTVPDAVIDELTPLHRAIWDGDLSQLLELLNDPLINVNIQDTNGCTPLHLAAENDQFEFVQVLIQQPDINASLRDNSGRTALDVALDSSSPHRQEIVDLLQRHLANISVFYNSVLVPSELFEEDIEVTVKDST